MKDIIRMNQLAGIITEGQAKKMMAILNENKSQEEKTIENSLQNEGFFDSLMGKKYKKTNTLKYNGYEMDVFSNGSETLYGHPRKEGESPSYVEYNLTYKDLAGLKKAIDTMKSGNKNDPKNWQSGDEAMDMSGTAVPSIFPPVTKKIKNPDFKGFSVD